jgi:hypothetical protein
MPAAETVTKVPTQALDSLKENQDKLLDSVRKLVAQIDETVPSLVPQQVADKVPSRKAIIEATFTLVARVFEAQDKVLRQLVEVAGKVAASAPARKAA